MCIHSPAPSIFGLSVVFFFGLGPGILTRDDEGVRQAHAQRDRKAEIKWSRVSDGRVTTPWKLSGFFMHSSTGRWVTAYR